MPKQQTIHNPYLGHTKNFTISFLRIRSKFNARIRQLLLDKVTSLKSRVNPTKSNIHILVHYQLLMLNPTTNII